MESFISSLILFAITAMIGKVLCSPVTSSHPTEVTYAELESLGVSCHPFDSCPNEFMLNSCDCDSMCSVYDTCCVNSVFRVPRNASKSESNIKCLSLNNDPKLEIFMVDSCKDNESLDSLCSSDPEDSNDPFLLIPVTSFDTGITYKNYFCAVCNEEIDSSRLRYWDMDIRERRYPYHYLSEGQPKFNKTMKSWTVDIVTKNETFRDIPVDLKVANKHEDGRACSSNIVQTCAYNWKDEAVALKCRQYMAKVMASRGIYRNPHCALCNYEVLSNIQCLKVVYSGSVPFNVPLVSLFAFGERRRRCGRTMVYDKFADKCRCDSKIYKKRNGRCIHKIL